MRTQLGATRRMLPGAPVVWCRRDPLETLWSCTQHHFAQAQNFSYDMGERASSWCDCERATPVWTGRYADWVHIHLYESLSVEPEPRVRALLDRCGLPFDAACLAFHENPREVRTSSASQVRQPLRHDAAITPRYGILLVSLRRSIAAVQRTF